MLQKIRKGMTSSGNFPLTGDVEVDESYIGAKSEGKRGRGAEKKSLVVVAVETEGKNTGRAYNKRIDSHSKEELEPFIKQRVAPGTKVTTDGLPS